MNFCIGRRDSGTGQVSEHIMRQDDKLFPTVPMAASGTMMSTIFRFVVSGLVTTLASYLSFMALLAVGYHYFLSGVGSWLCSVALGFLMNRRYTFQITGSSGRDRQFLLYVVGAVFQLLLALAGYAALIGGLGLKPTLAFCINLLMTTAFSFAFMNLVTFRPTAKSRNGSGCMAGPQSGCS